jgi:kynurenine formamidase
MKFIQLSYNINQSTPSYGGRHKVSIIPCEQIKSGNTANSYIISFYNHIGTHLDCPNHFFDEGNKVSSYSINQLFFTKPQLIEVDLANFNEISESTILSKCDKDADIIFFKTSFGKYRESEKYIREYPVFMSQFATYLKSECKNLKVIGLDIISLTSPLNKGEGKKSHQIFLGQDSNHNNSVLILEDVNLENYDNKIKSILISPFNFEKIDSAPCNVYGFI